MKRAILGISAYYHDSAAALLVDGEIVAAAQEERFTRKRHDAAFPSERGPVRPRRGGPQVRGPVRGGLLRQAVPEVRAAAGDVSRVCATRPGELLLGDPGLDQGKALHEAAARASIWPSLGTGNVPIFFPEHHLSHAASAFYPSPFDEAAIVTVDGVGEWATTTIGHGRDKDITILRELAFPALDRAALLRVHLLHGIQGEQRRVQADGPGAVRQSGRAGRPRSSSTRSRATWSTFARTVRSSSTWTTSTMPPALKMVNEPRWEQLFGVPGATRRVGDRAGVHEHGARDPAGDRGNRR